MRKSILLALGDRRHVTGGCATADAAAKTYWDQATGKWMKYDTYVRRVQPLTDDQGNTTDGPGAGLQGRLVIPRKTIDYNGPFKPGTIVINTSERRLYLHPSATARRWKYGIGVGRDGFQWSGANRFRARPSGPAGLRRPK